MDLIASHRPVYGLSEKKCQNNFRYICIMIKDSNLDEVRAVSIILILI